MFDNQKCASESPGHISLNACTELNFYGVRKGWGFRTIVLTEFTRNRQKTHDQLCVLSQWFLNS